MIRRINGHQRLLKCLAFGHRTPSELTSVKVKRSAMLNRLAVLLACCLTLIGCSYVPFSGGELSGTPTAVPGDWTDIAATDIVALETRPQEPYSVKLWVVGMGPALYIHAGATRTTWVEHIEVNPDVRMQIDESLYELRAQRITDPAEFALFSDAYERKYGNRPRNEDVAQAYLFRLVARP